MFEVTNLSECLILKIISFYDLLILVQPIIKMKQFILLAFFVCIFSTPTKCDPNEVYVFEGFDLEDSSDILETSKLLRPECYEKNICTFTCKKYGYKCLEVIYIELSKRDLSYIEKYEKNCLKPLQDQIKDLILKKLNHPLQKLYEKMKKQDDYQPGLVLYNEKYEKIHDLKLKRHFLQRFIRNSNMAKLNMKKFLPKIKRLCAERLSKVSPEKKIKELFGLDDQNEKIKIEEIKWIIEKFLDEASKVFAKPCECSLVVPELTRQKETEGKLLCEKDLLCKK